MICGGAHGFLTDEDLAVEDDPDWIPCCAGSAHRGAGACTCWEPVYDLQQRELAPGRPRPRAEPCVDCAYRPDSPEMNGADDVVGDPEALAGLVDSGHPFYCHQGIRRTREWRHPDGRVRPGSPSNYVPPIVDAVPYRANGEPAELCAGWAARRRTAR